MADTAALADHDDLTSWDAQPSPAHPHVSLLLGASLSMVVLVCVLPVLVLHEVRPEWIMTYLGVSMVIGISGMAPFLSRRCQSRWYAGYAIVAFDALPLLMAATVVDGTPTRPWASLILIPVLLTASTAGMRWFRAELAVGTALGFVLLVAAAPSFLEAALTCAGFLFFLLVCAALTRQSWVALHRRFSELQRRSQTDELTGLLNRRGLVARFPELRRIAGDRAQPLGMIMIDIDHFSQINADVGHAYGDEVLERLCELVLRQPGLQDGLVARIGGEELVVVVPGPAGPVAKVIDAAVRAATIHPGMSVSMGICDSEPEDCRDANALWRLVNLTDTAMYRAKHAGRNRIVRATGDVPDTEPSPPLPARPIVGAAQVYRDPRGLVDQAADLDRLDERLDFQLFGIFAVVFSLIGVLAYVGHVAIDPASEWAVPFLVLLVVSGGLGVVAIRRGRRLSGPLATAAILAFELDTIACILATDTLEHRMLVVCLLATPALVAAHSMSRTWVLFHGGLLFVAAALASRDVDGPAGDAGWAYRTLSLGVALGAAPAILFWLRERRAAANGRLRLLTTLDPLTGVHNRRGLERVALAPPFDQELHVLSVNIDGFKRLNDTYGHSFGDEALKLLADTLESAVADHVRLRQSAADRSRGPNPDDPIVARTGGDRFVVIHPGGTDAALSRRIQQAVGLLPIDISASYGSAEGRATTSAELWSLIAAAEADLGRYSATR